MRARQGLVLLLWASVALRADAGPIEAEQRYRDARASRRGPWPQALRAYRAVHEVAGKADPHRARAFRAMAGICWRAGLPQGAHAARAAAARSAHPALETPPFTLAAARQLLDDGDDEAARAMLTTLASMRYARAPREVAVALTLLARIACEARDVEALSGHVARMERLQTPAVDRLRAWSDLGLLYLAHGDRARAQQCLTEAERLQARASKDAREQRALIRLWLDLPLREALGR